MKDNETVIAYLKFWGGKVLYTLDEDVSYTVETKVENHFGGLVLVVPYTPRFFEVRMVIPKEEYLEWERLSFLTYAFRDTIFNRKDWWNVDTEIVIQSDYDEWAGYRKTRYLHVATGKKWEDITLDELREYIDCLPE